MRMKLLTWGSRATLAAILFVSIIYLISSLPGIKHINEMAGNGIQVTGIDLYKSGEMANCYLREGEIFGTIIYVLSILFPAMAWSLLIIIAGYSALCMSKLNKIWSCIGAIFLLGLAVYFFHMRQILKKFQQDWSKVYAIEPHIGGSAVLSGKVDFWQGMVKLVV
jgi:hypothetical protein